MKAMGPLGGFAVNVACYGRRVTTADELTWLREALTRLARHFQQESEEL